MSGLPFLTGEPENLIARSISQDVCKKYRYWVGKIPSDYPAGAHTTLGKLKGKTVHIANYYDDEGELVGQKVRGPNKEFAVIGTVSNLLFGRHTAPAGGKVLAITEGEIDALSYAEARENWPAVSLPNGATSAKAAISANLEYIESFEKVILFFDNDAAGRKAIEQVKGIISPGKVFIHALSDEYKDLNEALCAGDMKAIIHAVYQAEEVRLDGIVEIDDILEDAMKPVESGLPWFLEALTKLTYGRRWGELYAFGAGTGIGKTDLLSEQIAFDINTLGMKVGVIMLEQKPKETAIRVAGKTANRRFHVPVLDQSNPEWTKEQLRDCLLMLRGKMIMYDSFGSTEWKRVKDAIRHMNKGHGVCIFYVDHLTAMADTSDERGSLEQIMKEMAGIANELQIIIHFVSHLATPNGTPHEEGGRVMIRHFKGSRSIGFWSYFMFGLERDQQSDDVTERHRTTLRVLKDRYTGQATGATIDLGYDARTGRIVPFEMMDLRPFEDNPDEMEM